MPASAQHDGLRVIMVRTRNPLNMGAAARAMSNFGFLHLRVVKPYEAAFREARSAVGASALLANAEQYGNLADAVEDCSLVVGTTALGSRELQHPIQPLQAGAALINQHLRSGRVALLFGSEKVGLSNQDFSHCNWLMRVPTRDEHSSMNLGQAVAVCLYELARNTRSSRSVPKGNLKTGDLSGKQRIATSFEIERITALLLDALQASGYLNATPAASSEEKVRRLVRRLHLRTEDAEVWQGMLRQIVWRARSGSK